MELTELKESDFKDSEKPLVPLWLDIILFCLLCIIVAGAVVLALVKASVTLGFVVLWGGALLLAALRFGFKRARAAWS
ncbi:MAG: hypothetical protein CME88_02965 [Hirschia sp.]|nr:hypothetical protein [Hirschia sp.]MBF17321.1 hypothetical protein [Hirschia sp.]